MIKLKRYKKNPIISPSDNWWENLYTLNPGATIYNNQIYLIYRARGEDYISRFGIAKSFDGLDFKRNPLPCYESDPDDPFARIGIEDPRITKIDDIYYIVYCSASLYPANMAGKIPGMPGAPYRTRIALASTRDFKNFDSFGVVLPDVNNKDATLLPEKIDGNFVMIHRIYPHMWISYSKDLKNWNKGKIFMKAQGNSWEAKKIGAGSQPIKTSKGWLLFYHATDENNIYRLGVVFLDLKKPEKILYRHSQPIFEPESPYEKSGLINNVVFTCGVVEKDDQYYVYYGAADKVIGLAMIEQKQLFNLF